MRSFPVSITLLAIAAAGTAQAAPIAGGSPWGAPDVSAAGFDIWIGGLLATPNVAVEWTSSAENPNLYFMTRPVTWTTADGNTLSIDNASFDPDPVLVFSASATNNTGGPLTYSFAFNAPLIPALTGPVTSHAELGITLTDDGSGYAAVRATPGNNHILRSYDLYANGSGISKNVDIGPGDGILSPALEIFAGTSATTYSADSSLICVQQCVLMSAVLNFTLTARDAVGFSGKIVQTSEVPLPGALVLLGSGLAGLMGFAGRRRRTLLVGTSAVS
jgi:hypothetical protein